MARPDSGLSWTLRRHYLEIDFLRPPVTTANSKAEVHAGAILMPKEFAGPFLLNGPASFSCPDALEHPSS